MWFRGAFIVNNQVLDGNIVKKPPPLGAGFRFRRLKTDTLPGYFGRGCCETREGEVSPIRFSPMTGLENTPSLH